MSEGLLLEGRVTDEVRSGICDREHDNWRVREEAYFVTHVRISMNGGSPAFDALTALHI